MLGGWRQPKDEVAALIGEAADEAERLVLRRHERRGRADWNAASYQRVSAPLEAMGREVLDRLELRGDERVLDAGCGTGRVTAALRGAAAARRGRRRRRLARDGRARRASGSARASRCSSPTCSSSSSTEPVDAILSTATFHWIGDHDRLFERLFAALRPGGRIVAQCGGAGNVASVQAAIDAVAEPALAGWPGPWNFQSPEDTAARLERIGFTDIRTWPQDVRVEPEDLREYLGTVDARLAPRAHPGGAARRVRRRPCSRRLPEPAIDYVRLNLHARARP